MPHPHLSLAIRRDAEPVPGHTARHMQSWTFVLNLTIMGQEISSEFAENGVGAKILEMRTRWLSTAHTRRSAHNKFEKRAPA